MIHVTFTEVIVLSHAIAFIGGFFLACLMAVAGDD